MNSPEQVTEGGQVVAIGSKRLTQVEERTIEALIGRESPRIHSKLLNLPSRGLELIDFAGFMEPVCSPK